MSKEVESSLKTMNQTLKDLMSQTTLEALAECFIKHIQSLTQADAALIYFLDKKSRIHHFTANYSSLDIQINQQHRNPSLAVIPFYPASGQVASNSAHMIAAKTGESICIENISSHHSYDLEGIRQFDKETGYESRHTLVVPLCNHKKEVLGIIELLNCTRQDTDFFSQNDIYVTEILAQNIASLVENFLMEKQTAGLNQQMKRLNQLGIELSSETKLDCLLEHILEHAKEMTGADGGSLYLYKDEQLNFEVMYASSLNIKLSHAKKNLHDIKPIDLYNTEGEANKHIVAAHVALNMQAVNIPDVYDSQKYNFTRVKEFDVEHHYRTKSMLAVPLINQKNELVGVLQLINAMDDVTQHIESFSELSQHMAESLASFAAVAITNHRLSCELKLLIESFINIISKAIDDKSAYTGGHCRRVPEISMLLAKAASDSDYGSLKDFKLNEDLLYEMKIASMLHDCGKITTPIHIVDKATKLELIFDRIELITMRYEIIRRDILIRYLLEKSAITTEEVDAAVGDIWNQLSDDLNFLRSCNTGGEFMAPEKQERVRGIAKSGTWMDEKNNVYPLLTSDEVYNLNISKGTLNKEDREIINYHIVATINMLEALPFPKHLKNVAEIAGGHHERMDGKGYPRGLKREDMSVQARAMGIADIFEALTASDRPYRKAMSLSRVMEIMESMKDDHHIDAELFEVFKRERIYDVYAKDFLNKSQRDM